jgi:hypothetical protein
MKYCLAVREFVSDVCICVYEIFRFIEPYTHRTNRYKNGKGNTCRAVHCIVQKIFQVILAMPVKFQGKFPEPSQKSTHTHTHTHILEGALYL